MSHSTGNRPPTDSQVPAPENAGELPAGEATTSAVPAGEVTVVGRRQKLTGVELRSLGLKTAVPSSRARLSKNDWILAFGIFTILSCLRLVALAWIDNDLRGSLTSWDASYYLKIAQFGYLTEDGTGQPDPDVYTSRLAFFPGLPLLIRLLAYVPGISPFAAGVIITNLCGVLAVAGAMALGKILGANQTARVAIAVFVAGFPMAITFNMVYTEAPFLAATLWFLVAMSVQNYWGAGFALMAASSLRLTSIDLIVALIVAILIYNPKQWRAWLVAAVGCIPFIRFILWVNSHTQEYGGYFGIQARGWHSSFDFGLATLKWLQRTFTNPENMGYVFSSLMIVIAVLVILPAARYLPMLWWLAAGAMVGNIVLSDGLMHSRPRLLLPALIILGIPLAKAIGEALAKNPERNRLAGIMVTTAWVFLGLYFSVYMLTGFPWAI